ncbi:hypothetical protein [Vibrio hippocampi]|uniref:PilZ domain-containing protein n=1 Tax=Vibrio hippocampi TaxID=654686 RepID=A0ABM8ZMI4_9VIBR|nr:hypothetical protein [Vibrio hippocampi]CAH0529510.1 hypothetical protein VHP8226_03264 [Vibrio hippocampi]
MTNDNQRRHFRLKYPTDMRPVLASTHGQFSILQLSETNISIEMDAKAFTVASPFGATITYSDGETDSIQAQMIKRNDDHVVLTLSQQVTFKRLLDEQKRIRVRYPHFDFKN